jgi:antitoxin MazE
MSNVLVKSWILRVGSQGIRIPKEMLEQSGISDRVEIEVQNNQIVITAAAKARVGWDEAFARMVDEGDELDPLTVTNDWDETEWE